MADVTTQTVTVALQRIYVDAEGNAISTSYFTEEPATTAIPSSSSTTTTDSNADAVTQTVAKKTTSITQSPASATDEAEAAQISADIPSDDESGPSPIMIGAIVGGVILLLTIGLIFWRIRYLRQKRKTWCIRPPSTTPSYSSHGGLLSEKSGYDWPEIESISDLPMKSDGSTSIVRSSSTRSSGTSSSGSRSTSSRGTSSRSGSSGIAKSHSTKSHSSGHSKLSKSTARLEVPAPASIKASSRGLSLLSAATPSHVPPPASMKASTLGSSRGFDLLSTGTPSVTCQSISPSYISRSTFSGTKASTNKPIARPGALTTTNLAMSTSPDLNTYVQATSSRSESSRGSQNNGLTEITTSHPGGFVLPSSFCKLGGSTVVSKARTGEI